MRKETGLYMIPKYLTKDDRFNYDLYITDVTDRESLQQLELEKNRLWIFYN